MSNPEELSRLKMQLNQMTKKYEAVENELRVALDEKNTQQKLVDTLREQLEIQAQQVNIDLLNLVDFE